MMDQYGPLGKWARVFLVRWLATLRLMLTLGVGHWKKPGMFEDETLKSIAQKHNVSVGQMILRWHVQSGRTALPKTSKEHRMLENLDIFGFALTEEEIKQIDQLGTGDPQRTNFIPDNIL